MITEEQAREICRELPLRSKWIFILGLETGLRISDILRLKIRDIENPMRVYVSRIDAVVAHELTEWLCERLKDYAGSRDTSHYIFPSTRNYKRHLHRTTYHRDLRRVGIDLKIWYSAHSTRKLFLSQK